MSGEPPDPAAWISEALKPSLEQLLQQLGDAPAQGAKAPKVRALAIGYLCRAPQRVAAALGALLSGQPPPPFRVLGDAERAAVVDAPPSPPLPPGAAGASPFGAWSGGLTLRCQGGRQPTQHPRAPGSGDTDVESPPPRPAAARSLSFPVPPPPSAPAPSESPERRLSYGKYGVRSDLHMYNMFMTITDCTICLWRVCTCRM
eukprot:COSAG01_NODE_582_length_15201_cov_7.218315_11_plen_202_part_00